MGPQGVRRDGRTIVRNRSAEPCRSVVVSLAGRRAPATCPAPLDSRLRDERIALREFAIRCRFFGERLRHTLA